MAGSPVAKRITSAARRVVRPVHRRATKVVTRPFAPGVEPLPIVHCCHHRVGTVWWRRILSELSRQHGLVFGRTIRQATAGKVDVWLDPHSQLNDPRLPGHFRGTHIVRDPRAIVVSAYHYHLDSTEEWLHVPRERWGGATLQEHLRSVDKHTGLFAQIEVSTRQIRDMANWDFSDPRFLDVRFEEVLDDELTWFARVFTHYGLSERAVERGLEIVRDVSVRLGDQSSNQTFRDRGHIRSSGSRSWEDELDQDHLDLMHERFAEEFKILGYE